MTSAIDATKPTHGVAYTADVRANFATAASEITALQKNTLPLTGITGLPTTEPATPGILWINGGVLCVSR